MQKSLLPRWEKAAKQLLQGQKIVEVRYLSEKECESNGWDKSAIVLFLENGTAIFPSQDDEGNGPGALFTDNDKMPCFPVI